jgi:hypothetical protein|tara:strand:- start:396 stop:560 length:165 start_codon:yes stop_codon:yes gene_type:complete
MRVGDFVRHNEDEHLGKGKIVSFRVFHGTVLVKWENLKECRYHIPWALKKVNKN